MEITQIKSFNNKMESFKNRILGLLDILNVAECTVKQRSMQRSKPGSTNRSGKA